MPTATLHTIPNFLKFIMNQYLEDFLTEFPLQPGGVKPFKSSLDKYIERVPDALIVFWQEVGWSGFADGLLWTTDPEEMQPVIELWLENVDLVDASLYTAITRSAFGEIHLWGKKTGMNVIIEPLFGTVTVFEPHFSEDKEDLELIAFFGSKVKKNFDFRDDKEKLLFKKALKKLGPLNSDEIYAFEPALSIGGLPKIENLVKVKMIEHLAMLAQLAEVDLVRMDIGRFL